MSGNGENWYINQYSTRYDMWRGENRKSIEEVFGTDGIITEEERQWYESIEIHYGRWETPDGSVSSDSDIPWRDDDQVVQWESDKNWWYADPRGLGNDILLHDAGKPFPEYHETFSPVYPAIIFGGIAVALVLLFLRKLVKKAWMKELFVRLSILGSSATVSTLMASSGHIFTSTVGIIDQYWSWIIPMNAVLLSLTASFWRQMYLISRQDKAM